MKRALILAAVLLLASVPALAQQTRSLEACAEAYDACYSACNDEYGHRDLGDSARGAGCGAACAAKRAVCEAEAGYDAAAPWVEEKTEETQKFLEEKTEDTKKYLEELWKKYKEDDENVPGSGGGTTEKI